MSHKVLIFTDLDGSLLDHFSYSYQAAEPLLSLFKDTGVPVIPVTSKTRAELMALRADLDNSHPFIVENGAAVFIPENYFPLPPVGSALVDGFYCFGFSKPRSHWLGLLSSLGAEFAGEFETFTSLGIQGIVTQTGLSDAAAELANNREFSEPVKWKGTDSRKIAFVKALQDAGATVLQGGRFLHVTGGCNKGKALLWLYQQYQHASPDGSFVTIAAGDSYNDVDMLEVANCALVISSPVHEPPTVLHSHKYISKHTGPEGWVEGVSWFLGVADRPAEMNSIEYLREKLRSQHG